MKYIRTKDGIYENESNGLPKMPERFYVTGIYTGKDFKDNLTSDIIAQADTIEELCDCFSYDVETTRDFAVARSWKLHSLEREIYGCIKTNKGLKYVAKMNNMGVLELL